MENLSFGEAVAIVMVLSFAIGLLLPTGLIRWRRRPKKEEDPIDLLLSDPAVRHRLTLFLRKHNIKGDADIRDGSVRVPIRIEDMEDPLSRIFMNAASILQQMQNPNATQLYIRDSVNNRFVFVPDLDVDVLVDAAILLHSVAEEKRHGKAG